MGWKQGMSTGRRRHPQLHARAAGVLVLSVLGRAATYDARGVLDEIPLRADDAAGQAEVR